MQRVSCSVYSSGWVWGLQRPSEAGREHRERWNVSLCPPCRKVHTSGQMLVSLQDQKETGFEILLSLLKIINVKARYETCEAQGCKRNGFIPGFMCIPACIHTHTHIFPFHQSPIHSPFSAPFPKASEDLMLPFQPSPPEHTPLQNYTQFPTFKNVLLPSQHNLPILRCVSSLLSLRLRNLGQMYNPPKQQTHILKEPLQIRMT